MSKNKLDKAVKLFTGEEHCVLAAWLGVSPPQAAKNIDLLQALANLGFSEPPPGDAISREDCAVAHVLLMPVEQCLPQWAVVREGSVETARKYTPAENKPIRKIIPLAQELFTINWADSGPGMSWPERYSLIRIPYYDRYAVTASRDTDETFGYADHALGHFLPGTSIESGSRTIILRWWRLHRDAWARDYPWEYLFSTGLIGGRLPKAGVTRCGHLRWRRRTVNEALARHADRSSSTGKGRAKSS